jgi:3-deoxy-manno-octulosonate cytidylyltransferase (CMP-KDO synthetase)
MIQWVYESAKQSHALEVVVATDDQRIFDAVEGFGGQACFTSDQHQTGSDRILEVAGIKQWRDDAIIVNLQGDEPLMPAVNLNQVAEILAGSDCEMSTLYKEIDKQEALNPNQVKLVTDRDGHALYFSRSIIPFDRDGQSSTFLGHIGLYAYRAGFLSQFSQLPVCELENTEKLEQLRAIWNGHRIKTALALEVPGPGIDTQEDLLLVSGLLDKS